MLNGDSFCERVLFLISASAAQYITLPLCNTIEIISTIILSLPLIQEGHLLVSDEDYAQALVNHLED